MPAGRTPRRVRIRYTEAPPDPAGLSGAATRLRRAVARRVTGQDWRPRLALLALLAWFTLQHARDFDHDGIYAGVNLVLHEAGHLLFVWLGSDFVTAAGGTLFNFAVPLLLGAAFWRRGDVFATVVCIWWAGTVPVTAAPYIADARLMALPTVTVGPGPAIHDWNFMLGELGILERDREVAYLFRRTGLALLTLSLVAGAWVLDVMRKADGTGEATGTTAAG